MSSFRRPGDYYTCTDTTGRRGLRNKEGKYHKAVVTEGYRRMNQQLIKNPDQ